jgi:glutamyl/glutaminyl-tRNA synthetase
MRDTCRYAPSTTGPAHPGTMLAGLLCWLDARARGARLLLRLEDLDPERCRPEHARALVDDLAWLGLEWDAVVEQRTLSADHERALDHLAGHGVLYPSALSRAELEAIARRAPDGAWAYDNRERGEPLPAGGWRACTEPLRAQLPAGSFAPRDEGGLDLVQDPGAAFGDPVVRRRDGAISYQLAVVVDDAAAGVTRVVRGRDIAPSSALQAALRRTLGLPDPVYRHHFLLLEARGRKLAKLHGSVPASALRSRYDGRALCGLLAWCSGLQPEPAPCAPADLLPGFTWERVRTRDLLLRWDGERLSPEEIAEAAP